MRGQEIARRLRSDLRAVGAPETSAGLRAASLLDRSARTVLEYMVEEERRVLLLPREPTFTQNRRGLGRLEQATLRSVGILTTVDGSIKALVPELREPFDQAEACDDLDRVRDN
jgi:hypothetical protein